MNGDTRIPDNDGMRFPSHPTKNKISCCVRGCFSKACKDFTVRFHSFPKVDNEFVDFTNEFGISEKICRREAWKRRLMKKEVAYNWRVCSLHFKKSDYVLPDAPTRKRYLTKEAVPSCNLPLPKFKKYVLKNLAEKRMTNDSLPYEVVLLDEMLESEIDPKTMSTGTSMCEDHNDLEESFASEESELDELEIKEELEIKSEPLDMEMDETCRQANFEARLVEEAVQVKAFVIKEELEDPEIKFESVDLPDIELNNPQHQFWEHSTTRRARQSPKKFEDKSTQTTDNLPGPKFTYIVKSEKHLRILTGIPSFKVLYRIVDIVKIVSPRSSKARGLKMTIADRVIMTFMKLKQAMSYDVLSFFFKCSSRKSCKRIVLRTLDTLSSGLQFVLRWPEKNLGSRDLAESLRDHSAACCIVNRIEIAIQRPKNLGRSMATRSRYKRYHSVKFLTAITPGSWICFLSKSYGGRTSHRDLFKQSNVISLLKRNDILMILKDFSISDICQKNDIKLVKSLFKEHKKEISNRQHYRNLLNVNRTLRRFRIFRRKLSHSLTLRTDQIVTVICALQNLSLLLS